MNDDLDRMEDGPPLTSSSINVLLMQYLNESGLTHSAFALLQESRLTDAQQHGKRLLDAAVPPNQLIRVLHKGLLYLEAEAKWRGDSKPVSLLEFDFRDELPRVSDDLPPEPLPSTSKRIPSPSTQDACTQTDLAEPTSGPPALPAIPSPFQDVVMAEPEPLKQPNGVHCDVEHVPLEKGPDTQALPESKDEFSAALQASIERAKSQQSEKPVQPAPLATTDASSATEEAVSLPAAPASVVAEDNQPAPASPDTKPVSVAGNKRKERERTSTGPEPDAAPPPQSHSAPMSRKPSAQANGTGHLNPPAENRRASSEDRETKRVRLDTAPTTLEPIPGSTLPAPEQPTETKPPAESSPSANTNPPAEAVAVAAPTQPPPALPKPVSEAPIPRAPLSIVSVRTVVAPRPPEQAVKSQDRRSASPSVAKSTAAPSRGTSTTGRANSPEVIKRVPSGTKDKEKKTKKAKGDKPKVKTEDARQPVGKPPAFGVIPESAALVLKGHTQSVQPCAWNPKVSSMLATGAQDYTARIWDVPTTQGKTVSDSFVCRHGTGSKRIEVVVVAWNPEGTLLATGSEDGIARIWTPGGDLHVVLSMHQRGVYSIKWNKHGTMLLTASLDGTVCCWEASNGKVRQQIQTHSESVMDCDWFDEQHFASCSQDKTVHICSINRATPVHRFRGHKDEVNSCCFDPSKTVLASCSDDWSVRLWSMLDIVPSGPKKDDSTPVTQVIRNNGSLVLEGHTDNVQAIAWHPQAGLAAGQPRLLASASFDHTARIWDADQGTCLHVLQRHTDIVYSLSFSPLNGAYLAIGSNDGRASVFKVEDGELLCEYVHSGPVYEAVWHPTRDVLAVTGQFPDVKVVPVKLQELSTVQ